MKFKLAHKRADRDTWSASPRAQRKRLIQIFKDMIQELEHQAAEEASAKESKTTNQRGSEKSARKTKIAARLKNKSRAA